MSSLHVVEAKLQAAWPPADWEHLTVLVAVSAGCDSVALLRAVGALKRGGAGGLIVAHYNHRWRGPESDADERFVAGLCESHGWPLEVGRAEHPGAGRNEATSGPATEEAARRARYAFLEDAAARRGARYVATAHTADDQVETVLQRIVRGTGLAGLAGIRRVRRLGPATLIRPLLSVRRAELAAYLASLGQPFREDATNASLDFTRNRIRHELLPHLASHYNRHVGEALLRLAALAGEAQAILDELATQLVERSVRRGDDGSLRIEAPTLVSERRYLVREVFVQCWRAEGWPEQDMSFAHWDLLAEMLVGEDATPTSTAHPPSRQTFPGNIMAERQTGALRLYRVKSAEQGV